MNISPVWLSAEVQARIEPPLIPLIKKYPKEVNEYDIINIKMRQNPSDVASEIYELKIVTFKHVQPEEFLQLMKNSKREFDSTVNITTAGKINYLRTILRGEALRDFDELASQNAGTKTTNLDFIL